MTPEYLNILKTIKMLENKQDNLRSVVQSDICLEEEPFVNNNDKIKKYRLQGEYGEKKFIKP